MATLNRGPRVRNAWISEVERGTWQKRDSPVDGDYSAQTSARWRVSRRQKRMEQLLSLRYVGGLLLVNADARSLRC